MALTPPLEMKTFWQKFQKTNLVSQNFFCCSQNLTKHILVLNKSILKPLSTVYKLFLNVNFGVAPPPFWKKFIFWIFFWDPSLMAQHGLIGHIPNSESWRLPTNFSSPFQITHNIASEVPLLLITHNRRDFLVNPRGFKICSTISTSKNGKFKLCIQETLNLSTDA